MFENRLKQLRIKKQLTLKEFGEKILLRPSQACRYESGHQKPGLEILKKIHEAYGVNLNWLISGDGEMLVKNYKKDQDKFGE